MGLDVDPRLNQVPNLLLSASVEPRLPEGEDKELDLDADIGDEENENVEEFESYLVNILI